MRLVGEFGGAMSIAGQLARKERAGGTVEQATAHVTWGELGCPTQSGEYQLGRDMIRVKHIHILVAENDPAARFTVMVFRPPMGPVELILGHRVA